jgi:hypothetical protein
MPTIRIIRRIETLPRGLRTPMSASLLWDLLHLIEVDHKPFISILQARLAGFPFGEFGGKYSSNCTPLSSHDPSDKTA